MAKLMDVQRRQGMSPPMTEAEIAQYEIDKKERRANNVANAIILLRQNKIDYKDCDRIFSRYFLIDHPKGQIKYYPQTGRWYEFTEKNPIHSFGVRALIRFLKNEAL